MEKDALFTGIIVGIISPVIGYLVIEQVFNLLAGIGWIEYVTGSGISRRMRTILLLSICFNLIPFHWAKNRYYDKTLRGIVIPTVVYVILWVFKFYDALFTS